MQCVFDLFKCFIVWWLSLLDFRNWVKALFSVTSFRFITSSYYAFRELELHEVGRRGSTGTAIILTKGKARRIFPKTAGRGSCLLTAVIPVLQFQAFLHSLLSWSCKVVWRRDRCYGCAWCCVCSKSYLSD